MNIVKQSLSKRLLLSSCIAALGLTGCGSDDDSSSPVMSSSSSQISSSQASSSSSSVADNTAPVVNAGSDQTVTAGEQVDLFAEANDADGEVASLAWEQVSGPRAPLTIVDGNTGHYRFTAPNTGVDETVAMQFRLSATDDQGATSVDTVAVTVSRVNQAPVVNAGNFRTVNNSSTVTLSASAYDPDGEIVSYQWQQVDGVSVQLNDATTRTASFELPEAEGEQRFRFTLRAEDNDGLAGTDTVTIVATNADVPVVDIDFPPVQGVYAAGEIDVFGKVALQEGAELSKVTVDGGVTAVEADVDDDGFWRAENVLLPEGSQEARVMVSAYDTDGRVGYAESALTLSEEGRAGGGEQWIQSTAMVLSPAGDQAWVLSSGDLESDVKLISIDLQTGYRSTGITDFTDVSQGYSAANYTDMVYATDREMFYLSAWSEVEIEDPEKDVVYTEARGHILAVDQNTGARTELGVNSEREAPLSGPQGLLYRTDEQAIYIADEFAGEILSYNLEADTTTLIADQFTEDESIDTPVQLGWDAPRNQLLVMQSGNAGAIDMMSLDLSQTPAVSRLLSPGDSVSFGPIPLETSEAVAIDDVRERAYVLTKTADNITAINLVSGERSIIVEDVDPRGQASQDMVYSPVQDLLYVVGGEDFYQKLQVVDPQSGDKVVLSSSRF